MEVGTVVQVLIPGPQRRRSAPRCLGSAAMVRGVSAAAPNRWHRPLALFWNTISATGAGSVKTTWKYGTGSNSACQAASQSARVSHLGQWRFRQEL